MKDPEVESTCETCADTGWHYDSEGNEQTCRCQLLHRVRACLRRHDLEGVERDTGLIEFADAKATPLMSNAIIRCGWETFRSHLAGWLVAAYLAHPDVRVMVMTDSEIRSRWLGRVPGADRSVAASCLDELRGHHVVVRVRPVKHKATAPALIEAIDHARVIWLVEPPGMPLGASHPSWSDELDSVIREAAFRRLDLGPDPDDFDLDAAMGVK